MSPTAEQLSLPAEWAAATSLVDRFDARLRALRLAGLTLWTGAIQARLARLFAAEQANRAAAYEQLMLCEYLLAQESEPGATCSRLLEVLARAKGLLAALMLALVLWQVVDGHSAMRRPGRGGRRRDDVVWMCNADGGAA